MRTVTSLNERKPVPVIIGGNTLYCESFRASAVRSINEESTADGGSVITNNASRSTRLIFKGRAAAEAFPQETVYSFNRLVNSASVFDVEYMELVFSDCRMLSYTFDDKGGDWADVTVVLITSEAVTRRDDT